MALDLINHAFIFAFGEDAILHSAEAGGGCGAARAGARDFSLEPLETRRNANKQRADFSTCFWDFGLFLVQSSISVEPNYFWVPSSIIQHC